MKQSTAIHVGIIMDGNGRWATRQGRSRSAGHRAGAAMVRRTRSWVSIEDSASDQGFNERFGIDHDSAIARTLFESK